MDRPLCALRTPGRRRLGRLLLAPALVAGLLAGGAGGVPAAHALGPGDPPSCAGFVKRYFQSGLPPGSTLDAFSLTTESITTEATYAEARKLGTGLSLKAPVFGWSYLSGSTTEYLSTQRFNQVSSGFGPLSAGDPFNPKATRPPEVSIAWQPLATDRQLSVSLTSNGGTHSVKPLGCLADNLLYGTADAMLVGPAEVVVLSLGKLVAPPPTPPNPN